MVLVDIPDKIWRVWQASWESCGSEDHEELVHMLLAEIWEESWECLTNDGTFIPYGYVKKLSSIDIERLIVQFRGKSVRPLVRTLEKTYHCYQTQGNSGAMGNTTCDRAEDSEDLQIGGNSPKDRSK